MVIQLCRFSATTSTKIYDATDYWLPLCVDVESVRGSLLVHVPYITQQMLERWLPMFQRLRRRGVRITIVLQRPRDWDKRARNVLPDHAQMQLKQFAGLMECLQAQGIHVELRDKIHAKFVIADEDRLWEGSLNFLSHNETTEHLRRSVNRKEVEEVKKRHDLNNLPNFAPEPTMYELLCKTLIERREECGLSPVEMSRKAQVARSEVSRLEAGKLMFFHAPLRKVLTALDLRVLLVPAYLVGPVIAFIAKLRAEAKPPVATAATKQAEKVGGFPKIGESATKVP